MRISQKLKRLIPSRIDRYVTAEVIGPFAGGLVFFTFVFLMFQALRLAEFFIVHGIPLSIVTKLSLLLILSFLPMALPVAFLIAILVGFARLSADSELVAIKASGVSIHRMAVPVFLLSIFVVVIALFLNVSWVPWGDRQFKSLLIRVGNTQVVSHLKEGTFTSGFFDLLIYSEKFDEQDNRLHNVFIYDERDEKSPKTIVAEQGKIVPVDTFTELGAAVMLKLFDGSTHFSKISDENYQKIDFGQMRIMLTIAEGEDTKAIKPKMLSFDELNTEIATIDPTHKRFLELKTEYWRRFMVALSPLIFVFLGIGYGTIRTRAAKAGAALVAFIVVVAYWGIQTVGIAWSQEGKVPPWLGMSMPNIIMIAAAFHSYRKATW